MPHVSSASKAMELASGGAAYEGTYGFVLYKSGKYKEAAPYLERSVEAVADPIYLEHLGDTLYQLGRTEEALSAWNRAIENGAKELDIDQKQKL